LKGGMRLVQETGRAADGRGRKRLQQRLVINCLRGRCVRRIEKKGVGEKKEKTI